LRISGTAACAQISAPVTFTDMIRFFFFQTREAEYRGGELAQFRHQRRIVHEYVDSAERSAAV